VTVDDPRPTRTGGSRGRELVVLLLVAGVLSLLVREFVAQPFSIPSGSMERTLLVGDRILVDKLVYRTREPRRGEVVVFDGRGEFAGDPVRKDYVKRVIAVAGDRVACCTDGRVTVHSAGAEAPVPLVEPYVFEDDAAPFCEAGAGPDCPDGAAGVLVGEGRLWVMGDHRSSSGDSRANRRGGDGTIGVDQVVGRARVVVWPPPRVAVLDDGAGLADRDRDAAAAAQPGSSSSSVNAASDAPSTMPPVRTRSRNSARVTRRWRMSASLGSRSGAPSRSPVAR